LGQETGKTVLLASMFHRLTTEIRDGGFRLNTSLDQSVHLTNLYAKLRDPDAGWPPGTHVGETRSFTFTCIGSAGGAEFPILEFKYLDYAGALVGGPSTSAAIEQREDQQRDLEQRLAAAHALFGIIDGQRMLAYLRGEPSGVLYIETSIVPMIAVLRKVKCPVQFVLTKWDLFDGFGGEAMDENERLAVVRDGLMAQPPIRNLVEQRVRDKRVVRLIPVSAVGRQFVTTDAEGHTLKRHNGRIRPINVEIPLCAVLPDVFAQVEDSSTASTSRSWTPPGVTGRGCRLWKRPPRWARFWPVRSVWPFGLRPTLRSVATRSATESPTFSSPGSVGHSTRRWVGSMRSSSGPDNTSMNRCWPARRCCASSTNG
jgi:hypothetical protein